jgi:uncharacterized protein (TIGR03382 family)
MERHVHVRAWMRSLAVLPLLLAGCVAGPAVSQQAIVGGVDSTSADDEVVLLLSHDKSRDPPTGGQYFRFCSGTLVAPNLVLTARHCLSATASEYYACDDKGQPSFGDPSILADFDPSESMIFTGAKLPDTILPTTATALGKQIVGDDAKTICNADLALLVLDREIPSAKVAPVRLDGAIAAGDAAYAVGWGATVDGPLPKTRQRRDDVSVAVVGPSTEQTLNDMLGDREMRLTESLCQGDSGGPILDPITHAVIGVTSRGYSGDGNGPQCLGTEHTAMRVPSFKDLVLKGYAAAGHTPLAESVPDMAQPPVADPPAHGGGCSTAPGAPGVVGLALLAWMLVFLLRRRRAR